MNCGEREEIHVYGYDVRAASLQAAETQPGPGPPFEQKTTPVCACGCCSSSMGLALPASPIYCSITRLTHGHEDSSLVLRFAPLSLLLATACFPVAAITGLV